MDLNLEFNRVNVFDRCHLLECTRNENQAFIFQIMCKSRACNNGPLTWKPKVKKNGNRKKKSKMECRCLKHVICFWIVLFCFSLFFFRFSTDWSGVSSFSVVEFVACLVLLAWLGVCLDVVVSGDQV